MITSFGEGEGEGLVDVVVPGGLAKEALPSRRDERNIVVAAAPAAADTPATMANVVFDIIEVTIMFSDSGNTLFTLCKIKETSANRSCAPRLPPE